MSRIPTIGLMMALAVGMSVSTASAQLVDDFDSYANGTVLNGINGWQGWDGVIAACGTVSNLFSNSAPNSIAIEPDDDAVNRMGSPNSGAWTFTCKQYIPSGNTGLTYFIMQNQYNDGGPYNWSVQIQFNTDTGQIIDEFDSTWGGAPIQFDCWMIIQVDMDFDLDTCDIRMDLNCDGVIDDDGADNIAGTADDELTSFIYSWSTRSFDGTGNGTTTMGALDLFSLNAASTAYYDDIVFQPATGGVEPYDWDAFRGFYVSGDLDSLLESDDNKLCHNPGITIFPEEAPITLDFFFDVPLDLPNNVSVTHESSANTVGLEVTTSMWNWITNEFDVIGVDSQTNNVDTVRTYDGVADNHVEEGTGEVIVRYEIRTVSFVFLFPHTDCVDQIFVNASD